jgi:thiol-disulfide isomerase/thioredoxin
VTPGARDAIVADVSPPTFALLAAALLSAAACSSQPPASPSNATPTPTSTSPSSSPTPREGDELLGTTPPEWTADHWMNSPPLTLASLRGQVVLVRWFMSTECPLCSATAPSLRAFDADYRARGLRVVGMYHHKDPEPLDPAKVETYVKRYGYTFPVGIDTDWRTLKQWWLDGHDRQFTSVSFLLDRTGAVRFIHPGGKYAPGSDDEKQLRGQIERLLAM